MTPLEALAKAEHNTWVRWTLCIHKADKWWHKLTDTQRERLTKKTEERLWAELQKNGFTVVPTPPQTPQP